MKKQVLVKLLETIDLTINQIDVTGLTARSFIEQPTGLANQNERNFVTKIVERYFLEVQGHLMGVISSINATANLWSCFYPKLKNAIEQNNIELIFSGFAVLSNDYQKRTENLIEIVEILNQYHDLVSSYVIYESKPVNQLRKEFILELQQITNLIKSIKDYLQEMSEADFANANLILNDFEELNSIWLSIKRITQAQMNL